tara:strand:+ start:11610 stop:12452 length:843 start_codon:yes stop_codon:yes gene_type:complete
MVKKKPIIVAEFSINHLGMVNIAKKMVDAAVESGANLIKLKFKNVESYYNSENKKWRNFKFSEYRNSLELSKEDFIEISSYCKKKKVNWFCTVHDSQGLEFIKTLDPPYYKIASMDVTKDDFVKEVIAVCKDEDKPLVISLGGRDEVFTKNLVGKIKKAKIKAFLLHTVSIYPTPSGKSNINYISDLKKLYEDKDIKIGYSGHETGYAPSLLASLLGVSMIERHFTLSKNYKIHHIKAALTPCEFSSMVKTIEELNSEINSPVVTYDPEELSFLKYRNYN